MLLITETSILLFIPFEDNKTSIKFVPWDKKTKIKSGDQEKYVTLPAFGVTFTRNGNQTFRIPIEPGEVENLKEFFRYYLSNLYDYRRLEEHKKLQDYKTKTTDNPVSYLPGSVGILQNVFDIVSQENIPNVSSAEEASNHISDDAPFDEKKKKVLIHSNHCKAYTGFGKHTKNILLYLQKTGKYELVEFSNGIKWGDPSVQNLPWKCEGSLPNSPSLLKKLNEDPSLARSASYGSYSIDKIIEQEKPDLYIGIEDIWAFSGYTDKKWWNKTNCMIWTTLDSLPILPEAEKSAPKIKHYYTWASFAQKSLNKIGHNHVKTLHGALDTKNFKRLSDNERLKMRTYFKTQDDFIIGFVFRNQLRKSVLIYLKVLRFFAIKTQNVPLNYYYIQAGAKGGTYLG